MKHHHEKWEGGGYPDGLKGEAIPMQARIVTVADTFDAMTTTRPYQKAMEIGYVVERIKSFSTVRYDPVVIGAFSAGIRPGQAGSPAARGDRGAGGTADVSSAAGALIRRAAALALTLGAPRPPVRTRRSRRRRRPPSSS
jgi:hypothetical protein